MKPFQVVKSVFEPSITTQHEQPTTSPSIVSTTSDLATKPHSGSHANESMGAQQVQQSRRGSAESVTTIAAVATTTETAHHPPPAPPPLPPVQPQPQQRHRNRCPCGECCVCREFNTPGEFSFHAKAAVVVDAAAAAITITNRSRGILPPSTPLTPPPAPAAEIAMITIIREGSGCGGRCYHRHTITNPRGILPPSTPPTPPPAPAAEIAMITINPADVAIATVSTQGY